MLRLINDAGAPHDGRMMMSVSKRCGLLLAAVSLLVPVSAQADIWDVVEDTYIYEFLGNQGAGTGDSEGMLVWNHETVHGAQTLLRFDANWVNDAALSGDYVAILHVYSACTPGGFVGACAGDPGVESIMTDVVLQSADWSENDPTLAWSTISQTGPSVTFEQTTASGWLSIDVTSLVEVWASGTVDFGLSITQEQYPVMRADSGSVAVSVFCDSESSIGPCATSDLRPYLEIVAVADSDSDGVADASDNCIDLANGNQLDSNGDGFGNACDADINNDCIVNFLDLSQFSGVFLTDDADADFNGDGSVNFVDLSILSSQFFNPPGPSGPAGDCVADQPAGYTL
ncbi:MAG: dockerin type I domain-containing protein [Pseudomonadota bacterium]